MRILLIANTIFELAVAFVMIFVPYILLAEQSFPVARVLGGNAIALATLSWLMQDFTEPKQLRSGLIVLSVFHVTVTIAQIFNFLAGSIPIPVVIVHSLFAVLFLFFLRKQS